jgi:hypothetical protein
MTRLTHQGVRDLNYVGPQIGEKVTIVERGITLHGIVMNVRAGPPDRFLLKCDYEISFRTLIVCVVDRHLWARGWDTEEAKALSVSEALR